MHSLKKCECDRIPLKIEHEPIRFCDVFAFIMYVSNTDNKITVNIVKKMTFFFL